MRLIMRIFFLCFALILFCAPLLVSAAEITEKTDNVIKFDDGSYITITIQESVSRASYVKTGSKTYTYRDYDGNLQWEAVLSCSFLYDGTTSSCTGGICQVTVYDDDWYEYSNSTSRSGATATTELTMGLKGIFGITVQKYNCTITLTCDKNGNLS